MFGWFRELLEIRYEFRERKLRLSESKIQSEKVCESCEVLKEALTRSYYEKDRLLAELLKNDNDEPKIEIAQEIKPILPRHIPWRVRQQELETQSRQDALALAKVREEQAAASQANKKINTDELEKKVIGEDA